MSVKRRMILLVSAVLSVLALAGPAFAGEATDVVKDKQTALFALIKQPTTPATQDKIQKLFDQMLDYQGLAKASLGEEWEKRTPEEQAQFSDILKQLVRKAYEKNLKKTATFRIDYVNEDKAADGAEVVTTKATNQANAREEPVEIAFKMIQKDGTWKVADIITEGSSLVRNYRNQFTRIIKKDGFPALLKKMQDKLARGDVQ
jgi:phospholipid transport system substrate-binding protein